ncbi:isochorismatase family protein [Streptomyces silvensis]|nr:isochorismatase family protein [Streptomyces silvensis]
MRIPADVTYPMPAAAHPSRRTPKDPADLNEMWRPDPDRAALLVHDMQRYFLGFFAPGVAPLHQLLDHTAQIVDAAREAGVPVLYTAQPGDMTRAQRGLLHDIWGPGMTGDPAHREIPPEVAPREGEAVLTKWRYSAFARTDLKERLVRLGRDQLVICGVYAHIGCLMTAVDAFTCDVQPFLVADAVADFTPAFHALALEYARERCAATPFTADVVQALRTAPGPACGAGAVRGAGHGG